MSHRHRSVRFVEDKEEAPPGRSLLAGYRVVRQLAVGRRSHLYLVHPVEAAGEGVVVRLYDTGVPDDELRAELAALSLASEHLPTVLDTSWRAELRLVVQERLSTQSLGALLAVDGRMSAGEAVTILVSVSRALGSLHDAGLAHGGVSAGAVLFDEVGTPVLSGLGSVRWRSDDIARDDIDTDVLEDYRGLSALAHLCLEPSGLQGQATAIDRLLEDSAPGAARRGLIAAVESTLFGLATPEAVGGGEGVAGGGLVPRRAPSRPPRGAEPSEAVRSAPAERPRDHTTGLKERLDTLRSRAFLVLTSRRRPLLFAAGLAGVLAVAAFAALPVPGNSRARSSPTERAPSSSVPENSAAAGVRSTSSPSARPSSVRGEPTDAVRVLLKSRAVCLRQGEPPCLAASEEAGSPLMTADSSPRAGRDHGREPMVWEGSLADATVSLLQRSGATALVTLTAPPGGTSGGPLTVLLVKSGSGWALRDLFVQTQKRGSTQK